MDFRKDGLDLKRQHDLALRALVYAIEGEEGRADYLRTIARARYEAAVNAPEKKAAI